LLPTTELIAQVEAGDVVLCKNDLHALLIALDLSSTTMRRIQINYFWALCYNAFLIPVAAGCLFPRYHFALHPMLAGAAMALSSVSIVLSSLLLMRYSPPRHIEEDKLLQAASAVGTRDLFALLFLKFKFVSFFTVDGYLTLFSFGCFFPFQRTTGSAIVRLLQWLR
jgi:hypothetical protein